MCEVKEPRIHLNSCAALLPASAASSSTICSPQCCQMLTAHIACSSRPEGVASESSGRVRHWFSARRRRKASMSDAESDAEEVQVSCKSCIESDSHFWEQV